MKKRKDKNFAALVYLFGTTIILVCVSLIALFSLAIAGVIKLDKKGLSIVTESELIEYDGNYHSIERYSITFGKIESNEKLMLVSSAREKEIGVYENALYFHVLDSKTGADHTEDYQINYKFGTMEIAHWILLLKSGDAAKVYDGTPLIQHTYTVEQGTLYNKDTLSVKYYSSQTMVGFCENKISATITGTDGSDKTKDYSLRYKFGTLLVSDPNASVPPNSTSGASSSDSTGSSHGGNGSSSQGGANSGSDGSGGSGTVGPSDSASLPSSSPTLESKPYLKIQSSYKGSLYLRQKSFGDFTGRGWSEATPFDFSSYSLNPRLLTGDKAKNSGLHPETITIDKLIDDGYYFEPYYKLPIASSEIVTSDDVKATQPFHQTSYSTETLPFSYLSSPSSFDSVSFSSQDYIGEEAAYQAFVKANYLGVPSNDKDILAGICKDNGLTQGDADLFKKVANYVQGAARYNLHFATYPSDQDMVVYFLTVSKEGICAHFASAAVLLYRTLGIPARYTTGFYASCSGGETLVTTDNAHAWVEVYKEGTGWVQVEVTGSSYTDSTTNPPAPSQKTLTVSSPDQEWTYDGNPHSDAEFTYVGTLPDDTYSVQVYDSATITNVGTISNVFKVRVLNANKEDVTSSFNIVRKYGTLTVNPLQIQVTLGSASKVYDGTPLTCSTWSLTSGSLVAGHVLSLTTKGSQTEVGVGYNSVDSWSVTDAHGKDRTGNYALIPVFGLLTVTRS
jgi:hypothetical protein